MSTAPSRSFTSLAFVSALLAGVPLNASAARGGISPSVYWYFDGAIERMAVNGTQREVLIDNIPGGWGLDVSVEAGKMYWADRVGGRVMRANLDGSSMEAVASNLPQVQEVVIDASAGHVYWSDTDLDKIQRANLDGSNVVDILTGIGFATCMTIDHANGKIYFSESATDTVRRADLDGSNQEILLTSSGAGGGDPRGVDIDLVGGHIYFSDLKRDGIFRASLDGSNQVPFITGMDKIFDLEILPQTGEIYWFENTTATYYRSPLGVAAPTVADPTASAWGMGITPEPGMSALTILLAAVVVRKARGRTPNN